MIKLNDSVWYVKVYIFCAMVVGRFFGRYEWMRKTSYSRFYFKTDYENMLDTNLCQMMRVVFVWFPLVVILQLLLLWGAVELLFFYPVRYLGWEYGYLYLIVIGIAALFIGLFYLIKYLFVGTSYVIEETGSLVSSVVNKTKLPSALEIVGMWIRNKHDKVCSIIKIEKETK